MTGALRFDDNSAFGQNFDATVYPKASASWLLSDEPFFHASAINTFRASRRLRRLGPAARHHRRAPVLSGRSGPERSRAGTTGVTFGSLGNLDLKPERSREFEIGFDAGLFKDRVSVELTYYNKITKDALIERDIARIARGLAVPVRQSRRASGIGASRLAINTRIIDSRSVAWDLTLSGSTTRQQDPRAGRRASAPIFIGFYQRHGPATPPGASGRRPSPSTMPTATGSSTWIRTGTGFADAEVS